MYIVRNNRYKSNGKVTRELIVIKFVYTTITLLHVVLVEGCSDTVSIILLVGG